MTAPQALKLALQPSTTLTATTTKAPVDLKLRRYRVMDVTLDVTVADAGGTYDLYLTSSDAIATWDLCHFPQIAGAAKRYTFRIFSDLAPQVVTSAGAATNEAAIETLGANAVGTLAAGSVRQGPWGGQIGYKLVAGGAVTTGITFSLTVSLRD